MFIYSVRASSIKLVAIVALCVIGLGLLLGASGNDAVFASANGVEINYGGVRSNEERIGFIEQFGLSVKAEPTEENTVALPETFDKVLIEYNELQKLQGLDLSKYKSKRVTHYTYEVTNYSHTGGVFVNLYVSRGRIVGCDLTGLGDEAFVIPLCEVDVNKIK